MVLQYYSARFRYSAEDDLMGCVGRSLSVVGSRSKDILQPYSLKGLKVADRRVWIMSSRNRQEGNLVPPRSSALAGDLLGVIRNCRLGLLSQSLLVQGGEWATSNVWTIMGP